MRAPILRMNIALALFLASLSLAVSNSIADSGYSRIKEAYGYIIGTYTSGLLIAEVCSEYPKLKADAESTSRNYLSSNASLYNALGKKMQQIALSNGGQSELDRLRQEIRANLSDQEDLKRQVKGTASSEAKCATLLQNLRRGYWDLKTKAQPQIDLILGK